MRCLISFAVVVCLFCCVEFRVCIVSCVVVLLGVCFVLFCFVCFVMLVVCCFGLFCRGLCCVDLF